MLFFVLIVAWVLIGLWFVTDHMVFLMLLFGWVFFGSWFIKSVKCPSCGVSIGYQGKMGIIPMHGAIAHSKCKNCGHDLTK